MSYLTECPTPTFREANSEIVGAQSLGYKVVQQKFGYGNVTSVDAIKLTVDFDKAGEKRVIDTFVERG